MLPEQSESSPCTPSMRGTNKEVTRQGNLPHVLPLTHQAVSQCHCEGVQRPKQSHVYRITRRLPRSLRELAMTKRSCGARSPRRLSMTQPTNPPVVSSGVTHFLHCMINDPAISLRRGTFSQADVSGPAMPRRGSGIPGCMKSKGTMEISVKPRARSFPAIPHRKKAVSSGESPALRLRAGMFLTSAICGFIMFGSVNMMPPPGFNILANSFSA